MPRYRNHGCKTDYIEVYLFCNGLTLYTINSHGNEMSAQKIPFCKKSKKTQKAIKKQIQDIIELNPEYKIRITNLYAFDIDKFYK